MFEHRTRSLLGPADPARNVTVAPARLTAAHLMTRACTVATEPESESDLLAAPDARPRAHRSRGMHRRRFVLAAAGVAVSAAGATVVFHAVDRTPAPSGGVVLKPIAYQVTTNPAPAGDQLRALADHLSDAPYDSHGGRYTYNRVKDWGGVQGGAPGGYTMGFVEERETWLDASGSGWVRTQKLPPEYPDERSRAYFERAFKHAAEAPRPSSSRPGPIESPGEPSGRPSTLVEPLEPLTSDRANLTRMMHRGGIVEKGLDVLYSHYAIPREIRATILRILADEPGFVWRGEVTDRAGRPGVAVTADDPANKVQFVLVFNPTTGELLANELVMLDKHELGNYQLYLAADRTDQRP
jgi:hypothetical protein